MTKNRPIRVVVDTNLFVFGISEGKGERLCWRSAKSVSLEQPQRVLHLFVCEVILLFDLGPDEHFRYFGSQGIRDQEHKAFSPPGFQQLVGVAALENRATDEEVGINDDLDRPVLCHTVLGERLQPLVSHL